jgi:transcriptional regulator with XRE-family HTH domain
MLNPHHYPTASILTSLCTVSILKYALSCTNALQSNIGGLEAQGETLMGTQVEYYQMDVQTRLSRIETFREWVRDEMRIRGWNQSELARRADLSQPTINQFLNGHQNAGEPLAHGLARALGYPAEEVRYRAGLRDTPPQEPPGLQQLIARVAQVDPADYALLLQIIDRLRRR